MPDRSKSTQRPPSDIQHFLEDLAIVAAAAQQILSAKNAELPAYPRHKEPTIWRGDVEELIFARLPDLLEILARYASEELLTDLPARLLTGAKQREMKERLAQLEASFKEIVKLLRGV